MKDSAPQDKQHTYLLPDVDGNARTYTTDINSLVIIGANGSGKTHLGVWMEQQSPEKVHRIAPQRSLNFESHVSLKGYETAEKLVLYGRSDSKDKRARWGYRDGDWEIASINDFDNVLSALFSRKALEEAAFIEDCKNAEKEHKSHPTVPDMVLDRLLKVWNDVFPQRELLLNDAQVRAKIPESDIIYPASKMSDGERSALYLIAQVLCIPPNKTLIIDEPELHLHKSLMNRLWTALEKMRLDCLFVYITHDTQFASQHNNSDQYWIKEYDGAKWNIEKIPLESDWPEDLLLELLGNRKNVLFVEGNRGSWDYRLYCLLYPNYYVVPCGSSRQVIGYTKAFKNMTILHNCQVYGLIDRDFLINEQIEKYNEDGIFVLNVAEVESLFCIEEVLEWVSKQLACSTETVERVKKYIIEERFSKQIQGQIIKSSVANIKYQLEKLELETKDKEDLHQAFQDSFQQINIESVLGSKETLFGDALSRKTYPEILKIFNEKNLVTSIGRFFGIENKQYPEKIINWLRENEDLRNIFKSYLPLQIPNS